MPIVPSSALKKAITALPDNFRMKKSALPNHLLKSVKQEELDYSGFTEAFNNVADDHKFSRQELVDLEINRKDQFSETQLEGGTTVYGDTTISSSNRDTYFENVRRYNTTEESPDILSDIMDEDGIRNIERVGEPRRVDSHYPDTAPNYFSHSRGSVEKIGDVDNTRLIQEIQSDLHQNGRRQGYKGTTKYTAVSNEGNGNKQFSSIEELNSFVANNDNYSSSIVSGNVPDAPLKKNWARKEIEKEILHAVDEDQAAIAIPLEGAKNELARGEGVQKWYETQIRSTMKKITKQIPGAEYKEIATPTESKLSFVDLDQAYETNQDLADSLTADLRSSANRDLIGPDLLSYIDNDQPYVSMAPDILEFILDAHEENLPIFTRQTRDLLDAARPKNSSITYGQIILPPSEKIPLQIAPTSYTELSTTLDRNMTAVADLADEALGHPTDVLSPAEILDYAKANWPMITARFDTENTVWPELTPEIREVFKKFDKPPENLAELNSLQGELPEDYVTHLTNTAYETTFDKALRDLEIDPFKLSSEINNQLGIYSSNFNLPSLFNIVDEFGAGELRNLQGQEKEQVAALLEVLNSVDEVKFTKENWGAISKEQELPKIKTKVTPATFRYPEWTKKFELYSAGALAIAASLSPEETEAGLVNTVVDNLMASMPKTASSRIRRIAAEAAVEQQGIALKRGYTKVVRGVDTTAHTHESFSKLGENKGTVQSLAAHSFRGDRGYLTNSNEGIDLLSDNEFLEAIVTQRELLNLADNLPEKDQLTGGLGDALRERSEDFSELAGEYTSIRQLERRLEGSKLVLDRPLYITRWHTSNKREQDKHLYSALVINPGQVETYASTGEASSVYKLPKGAEVFHPSGLADENEVVVSGAVLNSSPSTSTETYLASLAKDAAPFITAGIAINTTLQSKAAEASQVEDNPLGALLKQGADPVELQEAVVEKNGLTKDQAYAEVVKSIQASVDKLQGDPNEIREAVEAKYGEFLQGTEIKYEPSKDFPETPLENQQKFELVPVADDVEMSEKSTKELKFASENFLTKYSDITKFAKGFVFEDSQALEEFGNSMQEMDYHIANNLRSMGRNVEVTEDGLMEIDANGNAKPISDGFWSDMGWAMAASEKEIGFGVGSALVANQVASKWLANQPWVPGKLVGVTLAGIDILAGAAGTTVGRGLDLAYNSYTEKEKIEADFYQSQMIEAGVFDTIIGSALFGTFKAMRGTIVAAGRGLRKLSMGNKKGAYDALKNFTNLDDAEIDDIITKWEKVTGEQLKGPKEEQAMKVIAQTQPDAEALAKTAAQYNPALTMNLARSIDARAKDVIKAAEHASPDNIGVVVKDELEKYTKQVGTFYGQVKDRAIKEVPKAYKFNYTKLAVAPFMKEVRDKITNPAIQDRVTLFLDKVERFENSSSFADLLDLRRTMNDFKYNTKIRSFIDYQSVNNIIKRIDNEVANTVSTNMRDGDTWLKEWKMANVEYGKMLRTKKNMLFKALTKVSKDGGDQGQNTKVMVKALTKHISDIDGTFMQVVSKLPEKTRKMVEGAVLEDIVAKHTTGETTGLQAINFPALTKELKAIGFTSTEARNLKRGARILSEVFKNDPKLHRLSTTIHTKGAAQALTDDLVMKARYSLMAKIWSRMQSVMPFNNNSQFIALGINVEKVLRQPGNAKSVDQLIKMFPKDTEIADGVRQLALVSAKFGDPENYPYISLHKIGEAKKGRNGKMGNGIYWSTDSGDIKHRAAPNKLKTSKREVLPERIATEADVKSVLKSLGVDEASATNPAVLKQHQDAIRKELDSRGYEGFAVGHDVLIFKE